MKYLLVGVTILAMGCKNLTNDKSLGLIENKDAVVEDMLDTEHKAVKPARNSFLKRMGNASQNGFRALQSFIIVLITLWPFILLITLFVLFRKKLFGGIFSRKNKG